MNGSGLHIRPPYCALARAWLARRSPALFALLSCIIISGTAVAQTDIQKRIQDAVAKTRSALDAQTKQAEQTAQPNNLPKQNQPPSNASPTLENQQATRQSIIRKDDRFSILLSSLPKEPLYYQYLEWYREHSFVILYVNGSDFDHLEKTLANWEKLLRMKYLVAGQIIVKNVPFAPVGEGSVENPITRLVESFAKRHDMIISTGKFGPGDHGKQAEYSPTWFVQNKGKPLLAEGYNSLTRFLTSEGKLRDLNEDARQRSSHRLNDKAQPVLSKEVNEALRTPAKEFNLAQIFGETVGTDYQLSATVNSVASGAGTYDVLPDCAETQIRTIQVPAITKMDIDFFYFRPESKEQTLQAIESPGLPIAYLEGAEFNPYGNHYDFYQTMARMWKIECLPTRLRVLDGPSGRVIEFREGAAASQE